MPKIGIGVCMRIDPHHKFRATHTYHKLSGSHALDLYK